MPENTPPVNTAPARDPYAAPSCVRGALGCAGVGLLALIITIAVLSWRSSQATDFPHVAPEAMADRAFQRSQEAYDVLGFERTVEPVDGEAGSGTDNSFSADHCYDNGPLGLEDSTVDGAYQMSHGWALDEVRASQAASGLRRLHRHLKDEGWEVTTYREDDKDPGWQLSVQRDDGDERMSFAWYPDRGHFTGDATVPCAYAPEEESGDILSGYNLEPEPLGPSRQGQGGSEGQGRPGHAEGGRPHHGWRAAPFGAFK
ncbi:hypothetical protein [Streptomyces shaanxiensis]|uniref:Uncharacterized protein n=1 Tax=Streptomyces shaanxiensis TaxID=653357 RepID=A0ABP7W109_9ACTN